LEEASSERVVSSSRVMALWGVRTWSERAQERHTPQCADKLSSCVSMPPARQICFKSDMGPTCISALHTHHRPTLPRLPRPALAPPCVSCSFSLATFRIRGTNIGVLFHSCLVGSRGRVCVASQQTFAQIHVLTMGVASEHTCAYSLTHALMHHAPHIMTLPPCKVRAGIVM